MQTTHQVAVASRSKASQNQRLQMLPLVSRISLVTARVERSQERGRISKSLCRESLPSLVIFISLVWLDKCKPLSLSLSLQVPAPLEVLSRKHVSRIAGHFSSNERDKIYLAHIIAA